MYFWDIRGLKKQLISEGINEPHALPYFLAILAIDSVILSLSSDAIPYEGELSGWDWVQTISYPIIVVLGALAMYRFNGGREGRDFFVRYFSLLWVVGIRFTVFILPLIGVWVFWLVSNEQYPEQAMWQEVIALVSLHLIFYWRLVHHIAEVRVGNAR